MVITYLGGEFVKVQFGEMVLAFNPPSRDSKLKSARFGADIALSTLNHPDMNGLDTLSRGERQPFRIEGPGEYEIKDIVVKGLPSESDYGVKPNPKNSAALGRAAGSARAASGGVGSEKRINTIYLVSLEGMRLCFLGALSSPDVPADVREQLEDVDILFVPVGGDGVLSASEANKLGNSLEPRLIIPIHWNGDRALLKQFLKETGEEHAETADKLVIKKKDLEGKEGEVMVLTAAQ